MSDAASPVSLNAAAMIDRMEAFAPSLRALISGLSRRDLTWKPDDGAWSILEIVCHLADEEEQDFRTRLQSTLEDPHRQWPPIDPEQWAADRDYNRADAAEAVARFCDERQVSIGWLKSLDAVDWNSAYAHPKIGPVTAGDLLASWAAHDALHLRQIAKRLHQLTAADAPECSSRYAGEWKA